MRPIDLSIFGGDEETTEQPSGALTLPGAKDALQTLGKPISFPDQGTHSRVFISHA